MSQPFIHHDELLALLSAVCDDHADDADRARLDHLLHDQPPARSIYLRYIALHASLDRRHHAATLPIPTRSANERPAEPRGSTPYHPHLRPVAYALAASVLLAAAALVVSLIVLNRQSPLDKPPAALAPVATVIDTTGGNLVIDNDIASPGSDLHAGDLVLDSGSADIRLTSGVHVSIRGATRLTVHNPMAATLTHGAASFDCPPAAVGYTLNLPDGSRVIDLGTRFAADIDPAGIARITVTEGAVAIRPAVGPPQTLTAGLVAVIDPAVGIRSLEPLADPALAIAHIADPHALVSADFIAADASGRRTPLTSPVTGDTTDAPDAPNTNAAGLILTGQSDRWNPLPVPASNRNVAIGSAYGPLLNAAGDPTPIRFSVSAYRAATSTTHPDGLAFASLRREAPYLHHQFILTIDWRIDGLTPNARYALVFFGASPAVATAANDAAPLRDAEGDLNWPALKADADGAIAGRFTLGQNDGEPQPALTAFQLVAAPAAPPVPLTPTHAPTPP